MRHPSKQGISYRSLKNYEAAIPDLAREYEIAQRRDDQMRVMDCRKATEETREWKRKAEIELGGGAKAGKIKSMGELEFKLWGNAPGADAAFETLFADLENEDPDIRAEASRILRKRPKD